MSRAPSARSGTGLTGLQVSPFRGLRFAPDRVSDLAAVTSPPYDVLDRDAVLRLETLEPHNVVRLILPREEECGMDGRYEHAARTLRAWRADGTLVADPAPGFYVYEQTEAQRRQRGLLALVGLSPPEEGVILPHEEVMPGPVEDRLHLMSSTKANLEPILLIHEGDDESGEAVETIASTAVDQPAVVDLTTAEGERHRLWTLTGPAEIAAIQSAMAARRALIADGHHRYAAYRALQERWRHTEGGAGPADRGLALLVDSTRYPLRLRAIHRCVAGLPLEAALRGMDRSFHVHRVDRTEATDLGRLAAAGRARQSFAVVEGRAGGGAARITVTDPKAVASRVMAATSSDHPPTYRSLDATLLHAVVLPDVWQVDESRVSYHHDVAAALRAANRTGGIAVLLNPVSISDVLAVAGAGGTMPRKSTSFGPKPRTGLVLRPLDLG